MIFRQKSDEIFSARGEKVMTRKGDILTKF